MKENLNSRFQTLLEEGRQLEQFLQRRSTGSLERFTPQDRLVEFQTWITSVANLIKIVSPPRSPYPNQLDQAISDSSMRHGVPTVVFQKVLGILISAKQEWDAGLLKEVEQIVMAETFDDFLDHASQFQSSGNLLEAAILASVVLEDTLKRVADVNGIDPIGKTLDPLISELSKQGIITKVKAKRLRGLAGVRNSALHVERGKLDDADVESLITGVRELLDNHF